MKRLNVKLLVWMIVICVVLTGLIVGLHTFQVRRNSGTYLKLAKQAEEEKEYTDAISFYRQYLQYHQDDAEVHARYALMLTDLAEQSEPNNTLSLQTLAALQKALQLDAKNTEVQGRMAKFLLLRLRRVDDAINHLESLRKSDPENAEWEILLAACRRAVGKYDEAVELLRSAISHNPSDVAPYAQIAVILNSNMNDPEGAFKVLDEMVEVNSDDVEALLIRYDFRIKAGNTEGAAEDLAKALALAPTNVDALLIASGSAVSRKEYAVARDYLEQAVTAHPDDYRPYFNLAEIERLENHPQEAIFQLNRGLKALPESEMLLAKLCETQLNTGDVAGAQESIEGLAKLRIAPEHLERYRAQCLMVERKWVQALRTLNALRPRLVNVPQFLVPVDMLRAQCYGGIGQTDLQIEAYRQVLFHATDPQTNARARHFLASALQNSGQVDAAMDELNSLAASGDRLAIITLFQHAINEELRKPADQRDWGRCDGMLQELNSTLEGTLQFTALKADYLTRKGDFAAARELLDTVVAEHPEEATLWLAAIDLESQEHGPEAAKEKLAAARAALGDTAQLRMTEVMLTVRQGDDEAKKSLEAMAATVGELPEAEQGTMLQLLANAFNTLGDRQQAFDLYEKAAANAPNDVLVRLNAFRVARDSGDDALMQKSLQQIKELMGENSTYWQYGEAARIVSAVARNKRPITDLGGAQKLIDAAMAKRPNWAPLHSLLGEIEQRQGNIDSAIVHYQRAFDLGDQSVQTVRSLVVLLVVRSRAAEAEALVARIPRAVEVLGPRVNAMIDIMLGKTEEGLVNATKAVEMTPDDYSTQLWYGNLMERAGRYAEAETALRRACDLANNVPDVWLALIKHYAITNNTEAAKKAIAEAEAALPAEKQGRTLATAYELVKDYEKAAPLYEAALKESPNDLNLLRQMAMFYGQSNNLQRVADILDQIVRKGQDAGPAGEGHVRWARRSLTQMLAANRSAENVRSALDFLDNTAPQVKPDLDDMSVKASLLAVFTDIESKKSALELLNEVAAQDPTRLDDQIALAMMFNRTDDWASAKGTMLTVLKQRPDDPRLLLLFADLLLQHRELTDAIPLLEKCEKLGVEKSSQYIALKSQVLAMQDQPELAISTVKTLVTPPLSPDQIPQLKTVANLLETFALRASNPEPYYEAAEEMYREYVREVPDEVLLLARFLGQHGDLDEALDLCEGAMPKRGAEEAIRTALMFARSRSPDMTPERRQRVQGWIDAALKDTSKGGEVLVLQADFHDFEGNYAECEKIYGNLLSDKSLSPYLRATVLNNLAYLMAVRSQKGDQAMALIEEAIQLVGPISELLDTRGMVYLAQGKTKLAIQDLRRSISDSASPIKLFHLALALHQDEDNTAAAEALRQAEDLGLKAGDISALERKSYEDLQARFPS